MRAQGFEQVEIRDAAHRGGESRVLPVDGSPSDQVAGQAEPPARSAPAVAESSCVRSIGSNTAPPPRIHRCADNPRRRSQDRKGPGDKGPACGFTGFVIVVAGSSTLLVSSWCGSPFVPVGNTLLLFHDTFRDIYMARRGACPPSLVGFGMGIRTWLFVSSSRGTGLLRPRLRRPLWGWRPLSRHPGV